MITSRNKRKSSILILLILLTLVNSSKPRPGALKVHSVNGRDYISMMEIVKKFDIRFTFDMTLQRGRLYHEKHVAVFSVGFPVMISDGMLVKSEYETVRHKGMVLIPADAAMTVMRGFFPGIKLDRADEYVKFYFSDDDTPTQEKIQPDRIRGGRDRITFIVIDAGHGGKDPGAIGKKSLREKNLTLSLSKFVEDELKKKYRKKIRIVLTRDNDKFIELADRTKLANRLLKRGDNGLFVSIHINASISPRASGFETYFLSQNPSNEEARKTAALENEVIVLEEKKTKTEYEETDFIEAMMMTNQIQRESSILAESIQKSAKRGVKGIKSKGVKKADFFVLRGVLMPAVLVEAGYITNPKDSAYLRDEKNQTIIAGAIADGIEAFIKEYEKGITSD